MRPNARLFLTLAAITAAAQVMTAKINITSRSLPSGQVDVRYSTTLAADQAIGIVLWSITNGSLPAGLSLNTLTGVIAGLPLAAGTFPFRIRATDITGDFDQRNVSISIAPAVSITTQSLPAGTAGVPYSATLIATGGTPPYAWSAQGVPAGLALSASGTLSGIPAAAGGYTIGATVTDATGQTSFQAVSLVIVPPPRITTASLPNGLQGAAYSTQVSGADGTPPYQWSATGLAPGLGIDAASGVISGTPTASGSFTVTVQLRDAAGVTVTAQLPLTVAAPDPPLRIETTSAPDGSAGANYSLTLSGTGGRPPYIWAVSAGQLPPGLSLNAGSGAIGGTPTTPGTFGFTVRLSDSAGASATRDLSIRIVTTLQITSGDPLPGGTVGNDYQTTLQAAGGVTPYSWGLAGGALPSGLRLDAGSGTISGRPANAGSFSFTVQVTDNAGQTASRGFSLTIAAGVSITSTSPLPTGSVGSAYSFALAAAGGAPPYRWSVTGGSLPAGLNLNPNSGVVSGTPTRTGSYSFTVRVSDGGSGSASRDFTLTVAAALTVTTDATLPGASVGVAYQQTLSAVAGTSPYTWSVTAGALPPGVSLNSNGTLGGSPTTVGTYQFTVQVRDSLGSTATKALSLTVAQALRLTAATPLPPGVVAQAYSQRLDAAGGSAPYTWQVTAGSLPDGLSLNPADGTLSGSPSAAGTYQFTVQIADATQATASQAYTLTVTAEAVGNVRITGLPDTATSLQQSPVGLTLASPYPVAVTGQLTLAFAPDAVIDGDDPSVTFSNGTRTADFSIAAGSTEAAFTTPNLAIQTGSVAGTITIAATLRAGGADTTPNPRPARAVAVARSAPGLRSARVVKTATGFEVWVTGYSNSRELAQAQFRFAPASGGNLQTTEVTVPLADAARQWYQNANSRVFGSQFTIVQPFTVTGDANSLGSVTVTLTNASGSSSPASANF